MRWIVIVSMAAALVTRGLAATDAQCSEILRHALDAGNPETRKQAVMALSLASGRGPLFDQLVRMLQDKDVEVRLAVVASLADVKSERATAALRTALEDTVPEVSFAAARALWARQDRAAGGSRRGKQELLQFLLQTETRCPAHDAHAADHVPVRRAARCRVHSGAWIGLGSCFHARDPGETRSPGTRTGGFTAGCRPGSRNRRSSQGCALRQGFVRSGRCRAFHQSAKRPFSEERTGTAVAGRQ